MIKNIIQELDSRGLIYQKSPDIEKVLNNRICVYWGTDPTSDSLHIGHLVGLLTLKRFLNFGYKVVVLIGGATALIGDPSGKEKERPLLAVEEISKNKIKIKNQIKKILAADKEILFVDNVEWFKEIDLLFFIREIGKLISVNSMLDSEFIRRRITSNEFISYAEFSYQLMQAYDFLILFEKYDCKVQIGGSDQWGNIICGIELIKKKLSQKAYGLSYPLVVDPKSGRKIGKTEKGEVIWLSENKTSPFKFYQYFLNLSDEIVEKLIYYYSFKNLKEIEEIKKQWILNKESRLLQKVLAEELLEIVFSKRQKNDILKLSHLLFEKNYNEFSLADLKFLKKFINYRLVEKVNLEEDLVFLKIANSKSESRRLIDQKGIKVFFLLDKFFLIKKGKNEFGLIEINKK